MSLQQLQQNKNVILTLPLRSQTSKQGISSTGKPARVMVFRCKGWVFSYPSQSTVRSTFSNKVRYDGARELLGSQFSLKSGRNERQRLGIICDLQGISSIKIVLQRGTKCL